MHACAPGQGTKWFSSLRSDRSDSIDSASSPVAPKALLVKGSPAAASSKSLKPAGAAAASAPAASKVVVSMTDYDSMFRKDDVKKKEELSVFDTGAARTPRRNGSANAQTAQTPSSRTSRNSPGVEVPCARARVASWRVRVCVWLLLLVVSHDKSRTVVSSFYNGTSPHRPNKLLDARLERPQRVKRAVVPVVHSHRWLGLRHPFFNCTPAKWR